MDRLRQDLRYAVRRLLRTPVFSLVAVLSLGLGIGANTAVFSMLNGVFFRDAGIREPERVVDIYRSARPGDYGSLTLRQVETIDEATDEVLSHVAGIFHWLGRAEWRGETHRVQGVIATGDYFGVLGVQAARGRTFMEEERTEVGAHPVVVLSHRFWAERLGRPEIVGEALRVNGRPYTVVGVLPEGYTGKVPGIVLDMWAPIAMRGHLAPGAGASDNLFGVARLAEGVSPGQARGAVEALGRRMHEERVARTGASRRFGLAMLPYDDVTFHPDLDGFILAVSGLLMTVAGLVLLVACTNLASFLLARATERRRELAVRLAMGAERGRIVRQQLTESVVLGMAGGVVGLVAGLLMARGLLGTRPPIGFEVSVDAQLDWRVLAFSLAVAVLAGLLFGVLPALRSAGTDLAMTLRDEAGGLTGGRSALNLRGALVVAQVAVSAVLLLGAGLFARSLATAMTMDVGFDRDQAVVEVDARSSGYEDDASLRRLYGELRAAAASVPGVRQAALTDKLPLSLGTQRYAITVPGVAPPPGSDFFALDYASVSPDYFEVLGIEIEAGRALAAADDAASEPVVILSRAAADRFWPDGAAVGRVVEFVGSGAKARVVGIAENVSTASLRERDAAYLYRPYLQAPGFRMKLVARGAAAANLVRPLRSAVREVDPELFVTEARTMEEHMGMILYLPRMGAALLAVLGAVALGLALLGLYGIVSYAVASRTREVGIRAALGATPGELVALLMNGGLRLVLIGALAGLALAVAGAELVQSFLVGVSPRDPMTFAVVTLILAVTAALAAWVPARRASRIDPVEALRTE